MKKLLLTAIIALASLGASAQSSKWYAGGQLTFGRITESGAKSTQVTVLPELGYNLTDRFSVGTEIGVQYRKAGDEKKTVFELNPYARYAFYKYERVNLFVDCCVDLGMGRAHGSFAMQYGIGFRPGISFDINSKFSVLARVGFLGYQGGNGPAKHNGAPENWGLSLKSSDLMLGVYYHF